MKNLLKYTAVLFLAVLGFSCQKYGENLETPSVSISVTPENPKVGDVVTVTVRTNGQYVSLFTGDDGHRFERSRIKAIMENDWESFSDTCYKISLTKPGQKSTWNRYFKDYKSLEEVRRDFEFFGAIENVELVTYNKGDFPESMIEMSYPGTNVLKLTVTDRRVPSGIRIKPNIHIMGGAANEAGNSIIESRFVACDADRAVRRYSNDFWVSAWWGLHTVQTEEYGGNPAGYEHEAIVQHRNWGAFLTNDPLTGRPSEGFYKIWEMYNNDTYLKPFLDCGEKLALREMDIYFTRRCTNPGADDSPWQYDLDGDGVQEAYECELDPATGLPVKEADYGYYRGFQGDVYLSFLEMGSKEYEPWNTGISLGSVYDTGGMQKTYQYTYTESGEFTLTAVATNIGDKQHGDIDYDNGRGNSLNNYPAKRSISSVTIRVAQ